MASVSRATLCRSVVHGVTGSENRPPAANSAAKSSGPSIDSKVRAPASQSLALDERVRLGHEFDRCPPRGKPDGVAGEPHRALRHLDLDHALTSGPQGR